jgi:hypothetical protein
MNPQYTSGEENKPPSINLSKAAHALSMDEGRHWATT